eukprot:SAG11_NODE_9727_length_885_cov_1.533079_2_plen_97_part_00
MQEWRYYSGDRWLPSAQASRSPVVALAEALAGKERVLHVATPAGMAVIRVAATTLEAKMAHLQVSKRPAASLRPPALRKIEAVSTRGRKRVRGFRV